MVAAGHRYVPGNEVIKLASYERGFWHNSGQGGTKYKLRVMDKSISMLSQRERGRQRQRQRGREGKGGRDVTETSSQVENSSQNISPSFNSGGQSYSLNSFSL